MRAVLMAGVAVVGLGAGSARADVVFHIQSTSTTPYPFNVTGDVIVDQAAADAGFTYVSRARLFDSQIPKSPSLFEAGLHGLSLGFSIPFVFGSVSYGVTLGDFTQEPNRSESLYLLNLVGSTATGLSGSVSAYNGERYFQLSLGGLTGTGFAAVDAPGGPCTGSFTECSYVAAVSVTQNVPEPATMTLLGVGLVGLAAARRRRAR